ncbi:ASCH domain-containing protein [Imtechella halotolerans]|uniref:ASCH domain-containing protein n=1 Tax=Imtechella halotolerans K1 TaxID=946077 RepID=I0WGH5_9FLAO|nr:ASCH domain-containing protein [Imtechella halotolerans]EID75491.1 ASCH domain-containing protein [Imtechella halotolerans K1]WMQ63679.1 ASCH domain-containing protein [Imtechella halotolerans]
MKESNKKESVTLIWERFLQENPMNKRIQEPISFYFCDNKEDADQCASLVVQGIKQATATSLWWFEKNHEKLPEVGDQYIITDWEGNAKAIIETIKVVPTPYNEITAEFAEIEGEGDKSLAYWKRVHEAFFTREMEPYGEKFDENMMIICEHFKIIYRM